jgi:UDP-N-acetylmuramoyl-tripeptide--D-alanyl-D-alanine ligase
MYLNRYKPMIIGVTGNAGKSSTKEAIGAVVGKSKHVRVAQGNLNNEFGLPLTILGEWDLEYYNLGPSLLFYIKVIWVSFWRLLGPQKYPKILVLEYGADAPGDIYKLALAFKPHISVITTVGDVPVHVEYFKNAEAVADEKANLVRVLGSADFAVLNQDDSRVLGMKSQTKARVSTYGFAQDATIRVSDIEYVTNEEGRPLGVTFKLNHGSTFVPVRIDGSLGTSQAITSAAAAAVGLAMGMNLVEISEALRGHHGPSGRLKILKGIKNSNIIDDSYNASPASMTLALETLRDVPSLRKIAVLGDMLELGEYTESAHKEIGKLASEFVDVLVCVGARAKFIAEAAGEKLSRERIFTFDTSADAKLKVQEIIRQHDLVLVKGSQGVRMEKIVEEIMAEPENKKKLLVRQSDKWLAK